MRTIYLVKVGNDEPVWMSEDAYNETVLTMSTGDYHTHRVKSLDIPIGTCPFNITGSRVGRTFTNFIKPDFRLEQEHENCWVIYTHDGDCFIQEGGER